MLISMGTMYALPLGAAAAELVASEVALPSPPSRGCQRRQSRSASREDAPYDADLPQPPDFHEPDLPDRPAAGSTNP